VAGVLRRFKDVREVFLVVDGAGRGPVGGLLGEDEEMDVEAMEGLKTITILKGVFKSYGRVCCALENLERRRQLRGPVAGLRAVRESLVGERHFWRRSGF